MSGLGLAAVSRWLLNNYQSLSTQELFRIYGGITLFLVLLLITTYFRVYFPAYIASSVIRRMRRQLYRHLQRLSADFYAQHQTGEVVSRLTNDITLAQLLYSNVIINAIFDAIILSTAAIYLVLSYPFAAYAPILGTCIVYGVLMSFFLPRMRTRSRQVQEEMGKITSEVSEKIVGMKVLQSFTHEEIAGNVVDERLESHFFESLRMARLQSLFSAVGQTLPEFAKLLVIALGIYLILQARMTVGDIAGMILVLGHIFFPLRRTASMTAEIGTSIGSMDRILEFFDAQPSVTEAAEVVSLPSLSGRVEYRNVSFSYAQDGESRVLHRISFEVEPGSQIAFVGPSGAGKSTIMDLLSRFYDPGEGQILIDGVDIREMSLEFLRKHIGIVMQDTILFSGTIAENVRLGNPEATDAEVKEALENAYAMEFVTKMSGGINSRIAEQGKTLSGGQRQRIALARMFLKDPRIIILDEATSALDTESEQYVQQAFHGLKSGRTTLMIAHHFATVKDVEYIYVVEEGRIVEEGTMMELMEAGGVFRNLYDSQSAMLAIESTYPV
ncbi:MAG: ABC transporter ATP-binding protein [Fidelibacterota bacterium]|nr:MAG: ABC transporter ATP-binding protein [Candidatus Neomarinimicrobiota bacterium]